MNLPPVAATRRRRAARRRAHDPSQRHLGRILLGVVEILAVVPEPRSEDLSADRHSAGPRCATTCFVLKRGLLSANLHVGHFLPIDPEVFDFGGRDRNRKMSFWVHVVSLIIQGIHQEGMWKKFKDHVVLPFHQVAVEEVIG